MPYDTLKEFVKHTQSMMNLTKNEIVNIYWTHADEIAREQKLTFIIRGNLPWKSEYPNGINITENLLLKSNFYESEGKSIFNEPVRRYLQFYMNLFEIWGIINVDIDPNDAENSKPKIMTALNTIVAITDALSFLHGVSLQWWPGRLWRYEAKGQSMQFEQSEIQDWRIVPLRQQEERTSTLLEDKHIFSRLIPFIEVLENLPPEFGKIIKTAINWHSTANQISNGLNRYLNYMSSIELLGNWYYHELNKGKKTKKKEKILRILESEEITQKNCFEVIEKCAEIKKPTARTKIVALLNNFDDHERLIHILFNRKNDIKKNFYDIRSAIAHGGISEYDFDEIQAYRDKLYELRSISIRIITETIKERDKLLNNLARSQEDKRR